MATYSHQRVRRIKSTEERFEVFKAVRIQVGVTIHKTSKSKLKFFPRSLRILKSNHTAQNSTWYPFTDLFYITYIRSVWL